MEPNEIRPPARVLVVDDNPDVAGIVRLAVNKLPRRVEVVGELNAQRALDRLRYEEFDLVVCDYRMREMDGLEFLALARPAQGHEKRLLFTAYPAKLDAVMLAAARLDGFLAKPVPLDVLRGLLGGVLEEDPATLGRLRDALEERAAAGGQQARALRA